MRLGEEHRRRVRLRWTTVLLEALDGQSPQIPKLRRRDRRTVIERYNQLFEMLTGQAHMHLSWLAYAGRLDKAVLRMIEGRNPEDQLVAIVAAGHMRSTAAVPHLRRLLRDLRTEHSLAAAKAFVAIDPAKGVPAVVERFANRPDWDVFAVAGLLKKARGHVATSVADLICSATESRVRLRALALAEALQDESAGIVIRELLEISLEPGFTDAEVVAAAVRAVAIFGDPRDASLIRPYVAHSDERVRRDAAAGLGRIGMSSDRPVLDHLLGDPSDAVRIEAAQALESLAHLSSRS